MEQIDLLNDKARTSNLNFYTTFFMLQFFIITFTNLHSLVLRICGSFQTNTCCILMYIPKPFKYHEVIDTLLINKQENIVKDVANKFI